MYSPTIFPFILKNYLLVINVWIRHLLFNYSMTILCTTDQLKHYYRLQCEHKLLIVSCVS